MNDRNLIMFVFIKHLGIKIKEKIQIDLYFYYHRQLLYTLNTYYLDSNENILIINQ